MKHCDYVFGSLCSFLQEKTITYGYCIVRHRSHQHILEDISQWSCYSQ